jgi:hypothetical protein
VSHGISSRRDFATAPQHLYALRQERYASYEVVVDAPFGRAGGAAGPSLARVAADGTTVVQSSAPVGTGHSRTLRFLNDTGAAQQAQFIRVQAASCTTGCTAADGYRLRAYETTYTIPRFNNNATQGTVVVVHNPTTRTVALRLRFWSATGTLLFTQSQNVAARGVYALATNQVPALVGQSGAVTIANDAGYGELDGKAVALEPASGYSFDSPMVARPALAREGAQRGRTKRAGVRDDALGASRPRAMAWKNASAITS